MVHGVADRNVKPKAADKIWRLFENRAAAGDKTMRLLKLEGAGHALNRATEEVTSAVLDWVHLVLDAQVACT